MDGTLTAGETYILTEISAPDGYEIAESIKFTVPIDGSFVKIEMTDRRKTPDEPERPTERSCRQSRPESETNGVSGDSDSAEGTGDV